MSDARARRSRDEDGRFMAVALRLSRRHVGLTGENPSVGTLIVSGEGDRARIVSHGVTAQGGRPHAERVALTNAGAAARGATAYVTLEPCAHQGQTGPCAHALIEGGIARVVIGSADPDPRVDGRGRAILQAGGIEVLELIADRVSERAFEGFLSRIQRDRPYLTLKMAVSADGYVGRDGEGQVAISGPIARRQTHLLRAENDAIMIGVGTALADDPVLTCRLPGLEARSPLRIVVDPLLRIEPALQLVQTARQVPTIIASLADPVEEPARLYRENGCRFLPLSVGDGALEPLLKLLPNIGVSSLLVEGGPTLAASLLDSGLVDRLVVVRSDHPIGGRGIAAPPGILQVEGMHRMRQERFGADTWTEYERTQA